MSNKFADLWKASGGGGGDEENTGKGIDLDMVQKPAKLEACVADVTRSNPTANAYAVCNAAMSDKSIASLPAGQIGKVVSKALNQIGISAGGPIPNSLLARQDLEPTSSSKSMPSWEDSETTVKSLIGRIARNQKAKFSKGSSFKEVWAKVRATNRA